MDAGSEHRADPIWPLLSWIISLDDLPARARTGYCEADVQEGAFPGTGKTQCAVVLEHASGVTLGVQGWFGTVNRRKGCAFFSTIELVNALEVEKAKGKAGHLAESLTKA